MNAPKFETQQFEVTIPDLSGEGIAQVITIQIQVEWDEEVKEWLITPDALRKIEDTKARHMGLLLPAQLKELRERYDYTQKEMGELFQVGEKSWTRWESGKHRPSRSINLLIRGLYEGEISINYLLKRAGKPPRPEPEWSSALSHWQMFAQCQLRDLEVSLPPLDVQKQIAVVFSSGIGKSTLHGRLAKLLQQVESPTSRPVWCFTASRRASVNRLAPEEEPTNRIKFPTAA